MAQVWTEEEIKDLIQYAQHLREENENLRAMVIASDQMIANKEAQMKQLKEILWRKLV
jgi:disulfide oxidoreductase YuzD